MPSNAPIKSLLRSENISPVSPDYKFAAPPFPSIIIETREFQKNCHYCLPPFYFEMTIAGEVLGTEPQAPAVEAPPPPPLEVTEKKIKPPKEKKPKSHKSAAHPPYFQMIKDAITALGEKSGSSPYAIAKHIEAEHKSVLPANFRKILTLQLKNSAAKGKLIKVKASYKLSQAGMRKRVAASRTPTTRSARANAGKPEETATKRRRSLRSKSVNQVEAAAKVKAAGGRRTRKPAPATKAKQPKSIRLAAKKSKKTVAV